MGLTSCSDDNPVAPQSIVDIAVSDPQFSTLVDALNRANLVTALQGSGPFTVFAPTNQAFNELLNSLGLSSINQLSAEQLTPVLLNHVVSGNFLSSGLTSGYVATLNSENPGGVNVSMFINVDAGVVVNGYVNVTQADIVASNGVIHVVDKVILPPDIVVLIAANPNFTALTSALDLAEGDLVTTLQGEGPFTVFAPLNSAFNAAASELSGLTSGELTEILLYHVVSGNVLSGSLTNGQTVTTLNGTFTVNISGSNVTLRDQRGQSVGVLVTDIVGTNGVIHIIDKVLLK